VSATEAPYAFPPLFPDPAAPPFRPEHAVVRAEVRSWVTTHVAPFAEAWEQAREFPRELYATAGDAGLFGWKYGPELGGRGPDLLADAVVTEELTRCGSGGVTAGLGATKDLAPYYVARFGTADQHRRWLVPAVAGTQVAALAVTEPEAGSDVAGLRCRATPRPDGGYTLDGTKCFITNGSRADWVLVAARTGDEAGWRGISLFVVDTSAPGFHADRIATRCRSAPMRCSASPVRASS
jgi:acyl-CoA dehydrogenase